MLVDPATGQPTDETTVTVSGEGTYTIDPTTGAVTFTPEPDFVGKAKGVKVQATATITNAKGETSTITAEASYTPTVKSAAPTAKPATSKDIQGATQTGTPTFAGSTVSVNGEDKEITIKDNSYTLLDKDGNEVTTTTAYAEDGTTPIGTFTIDPATGTVTFTPTDKSYTGKVTPVKVQAESSNRIKVDTTYTPEIVPVTPTATPAETTDIQGATQKGKPEFKGGTVTVDGVEKTVPINEDVPATFEDGSTTKTVEGVGTYTVAPDGTVTFVPEKSFVGKAPSVTVVREDMNGTKASSTYTPTVTPVTTFVDKDGKAIPGYPTEDGENPKKDIPGYRFVETKKLPNGDTEHVYEKVKTSHKDKDGNEIPGYPTEDGEQPKKDIPGYRFVETKKLPNGDTVHVYEKITTTHVDENGNPIPGYPTEDGEQPKKDIPGYEFVKTVVDANGNIQHIYKKVVTPEKPEAPVKPTPAKENAPQLPNTGTEDHASLAALGLVGVLSGFGLIARKKKED